MLEKAMSGFKIYFKNKSGLVPICFLIKIYFLSYHLHARIHILQSLLFKWLLDITAYDNTTAFDVSFIQISDHFWINSVYSETIINSNDEALIL